MARRGTVARIERVFLGMVFAAVALVIERRVLRGIKGKAVAEPRATTEVSQDGR